MLLLLLCVVGGVVVVVVVVVGVVVSAAVQRMVRLRLLVWLGLARFETVCVCKSAS